MQKTYVRRTWKDSKGVIFFIRVYTIPGEEVVSEWRKPDYYPQGASTFETEYGVTVPDPVSEGDIDPNNYPEEPYEPRETGPNKTVKYYNDDGKYIGYRVFNYRGEQIGQGWVKGFGPGDIAGSNNQTPSETPTIVAGGSGSSGGSSGGDSGGGSVTKPPKTAGDFSPGLGSFDYPPKQDGAIAFYIGENANGKWTKSIMPSGAVIMQVGDNKPDRIGWVVPGSTTLDGMVDGGSDTNPLKDFIGGPGGVYPGETVDPSRIQITETGAVLQRKGEGGGYYRIGWISPDLGKKYAGYYSNVPDEVKGGMQSGDYDKNPYVPGNPGYEGAGGDDDQSNSTITQPFTDVEPKDGLDDVTGLPEDQFKRVYPEGAPQYGSDNEPEDPNLRSLMGTKTEEEALKKLQSELGPNDTPKDNWDASAPENQGVTDPIKSTWVDGSGLPTVGGGFDPLTPEEQGSDGGGGKNAQMM